MGKIAQSDIIKGETMYVPTGGMLPESADSVIMIEDTEEFTDCEIGLLKSVTFGENVRNNFVQHTLYEVIRANDIYKMTEGLMKHIFQKCMNIQLPEQFQRLSYMDAMNTYGSDKPELRFDMKLQDFSPFVPGSVITSYSIHYTKLYEQ